MPSGDHSSVKDGVGVGICVGLESGADDDVQLVTNTRSKRMSTKRNICLIATSPWTTTCTVQDNTMELERYSLTSLVMFSHLNQRPIIII